MKTNKFAIIKTNKTNIKRLKIAIVQARFNQKITDNLVKGAIKALQEFGLKRDNYEVHQVPGSFEIPIKCLKLAKSGKYSGIITIGAVIKGETAHFDYVAGGAVNGIMKVMLDSGIVISLGVITTYNLKQAQERSKNNKQNKGYEAAMALMEMMS